jgi:hypothetical protein
MMCSPPGLAGTGRPSGGRPQVFVQFRYDERDIQTVPEAIGGIPGTVSDSRQTDPPEGLRGSGRPSNGEGDTGYSPGYYRVSREGAKDKW